MNETAQTLSRKAFTTLRYFARCPPPVERCELCGASIATGHSHLLEPAQRKLICACDPCSLLFAPPGAKYKRVPRQVRVLADFQMPDSQWAGLMLPINLAFFFHSTPHGRVVAMYPSPAGAMESLLTLGTWGDIEQANPALRRMEADVEALLVNRVEHARGAGVAEYYLAPIDSCYELVGVIRSRWRGLSGGTEVWEQIHAFFSALKAGTARETFHA